MPNTHDLLFRTLADPTRRALFERLCREGEQTVGALTAQSGFRSRPSRNISAYSGRPGWCSTAMRGARPITAQGPGRSGR